MYMSPPPFRTARLSPLWVQEHLPADGVPVGFGVDGGDVGDGDAAVGYGGDGAFGRKGQLQALHFAHYPRSDFVAAEQIAEVEAVVPDFQIPRGVGTADLDDFAIHRREHAHVGVALAGAPRGSVHGDAVARLRQVHTVRLAEEAAA